MTDKWVWSDQHLFHDNTWALFKKADGYPLRPFKSTLEMHTTMLLNHNNVVKDGDYVYWVGDVTLKYHKEFRELMSQFKGKKRLILGNHDKIKGTNLLDWFEKVELWKGFADKDVDGCGFTMSHIPLRLDSLRDGAFNVHGHTHANILADPHYINVCVENWDYTPIHFDTIFEIIRDRKKDLDNRAKIDRKLNQ